MRQAFQYGRSSVRAFHGREAEKAAGAGKACSGRDVVMGRVAEAGDRSKIRYG